jgi:drug/metabolite transporter (DMT)-like permease
MTDACSLANQLGDLVPPIESDTRTSRYVVTMAWLVVAVSFGAYALMWMLLIRIDATRVASLFYLGPPVTMFMGWLAFGDTPIISDFAGLAVVAVGVAAVMVRRRRRA